MRNSQKWEPSKALIRNDYPVPNLSKIYGGSYFIIRLQLRSYFRLLTKYSRGLLLDAGCGNVPYYEFYKPKIKDSICMDITENNFTDLTFDLSKGFPLDSNTFDTILLADVMNHVSDTDILIQECSRVLRSEGKVLIFSPFQYWINEPPHDYYRFTRYALERYCGKYHLKIEEYFEYGGYLEVLFDLINKKMAHGLKFRIFRLLTWIYFMFFDKRKRNSPSNFVLGYCVVLSKS